MGWSTPTDYYWMRSRQYNVPVPTMNAWYKEACDLYNLSAHFDVFRDCVENEVYYDREAYWKARRNRWYHKQENGAFRKAEHHKKKVLSDEEKRKREWRKKVKDPRDQGSRFYNESGWTCLQRKANRAERRKVKAKLQSGNWEEYGKTYWLGEDQMTPWYPENEWDNWVNPKRREHLDPWDYY